jgi:hypothetical protein
MYKLHYASLNLQGDIPCYDFQELEDIANFILTLQKTQKDIVYLLAYEEEVFISDYIITIAEVLSKDVSESLFFCTDKNVFFQEYSSYQEAYKVALMIKETSPLCYEPE